MTAKGGNPEVRFAFAVVLAAGLIFTEGFAADQAPAANASTIAGCNDVRLAAGVTPDRPPLARPCAERLTPALVAERALAQTGLAIGLASTVLQSQIAILETILNGSTNCTQLPGGGSMQPAGSTVTVYYGSACSQPYVVATPSTTTDASSGLINIVETALYYGLNGSNSGAMTLNESAVASGDGSSINVYGLGIFTPVSGARTPVQLGLYCGIGTGSLAQCGGGIAQDFPTLKMSIGAVTPLNLTVNVNDLSAPVTFTGGGLAVTGALGGLTLTNPAPASLVIKGGSGFTTFTSTGGAAEFTLFPPTPTAWTLTDSAHGQQFSISVVSNTTRNLTLKIATLRGVTLATGAIDQSGSGTVTYSDGTTVPVTNWTLAD